MGPTYIKIGQALSIRADLISPPYIAALTGLQAAAEDASEPDKRVISVRTWHTGHVDHLGNVQEDGRRSRGVAGLGGPPQLCEGDGRATLTASEPLLLGALGRATHIHTSTPTHALADATQPRA